MGVSQRRLIQIFAVLAAWAIVVIVRLVHIHMLKHE